MANNKTRLTVDMSITQMLITMSDGNPGALTCLMQMMKEDPDALLDILLFDTIGIYGTKIYLLWNDCCKRDMVKLKETIRAFQDGKFSDQEILANLSQTYARPFI